MKPSRPVSLQHDIAMTDNRNGLTAFEIAQAVTGRRISALGHDAITAFRAARSPVGLTRKTAKTVITTYGRDTAVASTLFYRDSLPGRVGRQMQTWVRFPEGWKIVAAHVSIIDEPQGQKT